MSFLRPEDLVLGIDGGGTKTVAWLAMRAEGIQADEILGSGTAGGSNLQTQGKEVSVANLDAAIDGAFAAAGLERQSVAATVAALAGSDRDENRRVFEAWARDRGFAHRFRITHDLEPVLAAGTPKGWGLALTAGTGSLAYARSPEGKTARAGGWGYLFGDEGSAYWITIESLRAAARAADGRGPDTTLVGACKGFFGAKTLADLVRAVYPLAKDRAAIAAFADLVFVMAAQGDAAAKEILERAAHELAAMAVAAAKAADLTHAQIPLAITGGVLLHQQMYLSYVCELVRDQGLSVGNISQVLDPVWGAVILARREAIG